MKFTATRLGLSAGAALVGLSGLAYWIVGRPTAAPAALAQAQAGIPLPAAPVRASQPGPALAATAPVAVPSAVSAPARPLVLDRQRLQQQIGTLLQAEALIRLNAYVEAVDCQAGRCTADLAVPATSAEARSKGAAAVADIMDHMKEGLREAGLTLGIRSIGQSDQGLKARFEVSPQEAEQTHVLTAEQISQMRMETLKQAERGR